MKNMLASLLLALSFAANANTTNLIVGFPPGGSFDTLARRFANYAEKELGNNIVVHNVVGAGTVVALSRLDSSESNTIMVTGSAHYAALQTSNTLLNKYRYIGIFGESYLYLAVAKKYGLTCEDFKNKNNKFFVGTAGPGTSSSTAGVMITDKLKNITEVPYRGVPLQTTDLLNNQIQMSILVSLGSNRPDYTIIANTSTKSLDGFPSWNECLGIEGMIRNQFMVIGKSDATDEYVNKINSIVNKFVKDPDTIKYFKDNGIVPREADTELVKKLVEFENRANKK